MNTMNDILLASECVQKAAFLAKNVGVDLDLIKNTYSNLSEINISSSELNLKERLAVLNAELFAVDQILNYLRDAFAVLECLELAKRDNEENNKNLL